MSQDERAVHPRNRQQSTNRGWWLFARNFLKNPTMLGGLVPSSRFLIKEVLRRVDWDSAHVVIEYGPGVGTITAEILRRMRPDATLLALETNPEFIPFLRESLPDSRLQVVQESAERVDQVMQRLNLPAADYIISGVPFKLLPDAVRDTIIGKTHKVLRPNGMFVLYQFSNAVLPSLQRVFRKVYKDFEPLNILPARLFHCVR